MTKHKRIFDQNVVAAKTVSAIHFIEKMELAKQNLSNQYV